MAKNKHSTALFEVIHSAKKPPQRSPSGGIPVPKWWWKSKGKTQAAPIAAAAPVGIPVATPGSIPPEPPSIAPVAFSVPPEPPTAPVPPQQIFTSPLRLADDFEDSAPIQIAAPAVKSAAKPEPGLDGESPLRLDPDHREIRFHLSYGGAAAAAFIVVLIIAIAYLAGTRSNLVGMGDDDTSDGQPAVASGSAQNKDPNILAAVASDTSSGATSAGAAVAPANVPSHSVENTLPTFDAVPTTPENVSRQVGLNYIIAQSFPNQDLAKQACDFLNHSGIPCTVVHALPGWTLKSWYSVVTVKSFDHIKNNRELDAYRDAIEAAGVKFAGQNPFNRFKTNVYTWKANSDSPDAN